MKLCARVPGDPKTSPTPRVTTGARVLLPRRDVGVLVASITRHDDDGLLGPEGALLGEVVYDPGCGATGGPDGLDRAVGFPNGFVSMDWTAGMRLARLQTPEGVVRGRYDDGTVIADDGAYRVGRDGALTYPCEPSALYCVGRNYAATLDQMDYDRPDEPDFFIKPPASLVGPAEPIRYPAWSDELTYAGELVAVVDRRCRDLDPDAVPDVIRGYTIMNDVDALDQPGRTARKAFDTSAPLGPWIETDLDPAGVDMKTVIGGERRQAATTDQMLVPPAEVVAFLSRRFTLRPGDAIAFGSPANPGTITPGDEVAITYEGIGTLRNPVVG